MVVWSARTVVNHWTRPWSPTVRLISAQMAQDRPSRSVSWENLRWEDSQRGSRPSEKKVGTLGVGQVVPISHDFPSWETTSNGDSPPVARRFKSCKHHSHRKHLGSTASPSLPGNATRTKALRKNNVIFLIAQLLGSSHFSQRHCWFTQWLFTSPSQGTNPGTVIK